MEWEEKRRRLEQRLGATIEVRGMKPPEPRIRGRIRRRGSHVIVEYHEGTPGYFWHVEIVNYLLDLLAWPGVRFLVLYELNRRGEEEE